VFSSIVDALDKDTDLKGIKKIVAEGEWLASLASAVQVSHVFVFQLENFTRRKESAKNHKLIFVA
jgi:hypothetical protein